MLRGLISLLQANSKRAYDFCYKAGSKTVAEITLTHESEGRSIKWQNEELEAQPKIPILAIPDSRFIDRAGDTFTPPGEVDLPRDGAKHFLEQRSFEALIQNLLHKISLEKIRSRRDFKKIPIFWMLTEVVRELSDSDFEFDEIAINDQGGYKIMVRTEGNLGTPLPLQLASQGTLSLLAVFGLIYTFLRAVHNPRTNDEVFEQHGIVLIDEIDAHLHPLWQQQLVPLLRRTFPQVQYILTGHSPLLVAGCHENEVSVLRKEEQSKRFSLEQIPHDFIGSSPEEIYEDVFRIERRDRSYDHYTSLELRKTAMLEELEELSTSARSSRDEERFRELENELRTLGHVRRRRAHQIELDKLERENRILTRKFEKAK